jgi:hypothetical protein
MFHIPFEKRFYRNNGYGKSKDLRGLQSGNMVPDKKWLYRNAGAFFHLYSFDDQQRIWYKTSIQSARLPDFSEVKILSLNFTGSVLPCSVFVLGHIF